MRMKRRRWDGRDLAACLRRLRVVAVRRSVVTPAVGGCSTTAALPCPCAPSCRRSRWRRAAAGAAHRASTRARRRRAARPRVRRRGWLLLFARYSRGSLELSSARPAPECAARALPSGLRTHAGQSSSSRSRLAAHAEQQLSSPHVLPPLTCRRSPLLLAPCRRPPSPQAPAAATTAAWACSRASSSRCWTTPRRGCLT